MHIIFSHGRLGKPDGRKIKALSALASMRGHTCDSIDYTDTLDPDIRANRLSGIVAEQSKPFVLVGSSMGGYAALIAGENADKDLLRGIFLMAPALYLPRYQQQQFSTDFACVEIVHGWHDTVVLYEHSVRYARAANASLHLLNDDHFLSQQPQILAELFVDFLGRIN